MSGERKTVFQTEWFSVEQENFDHIPFLNGEPYYRINSPDGVLILALTEMDEVILVKQFRPAIHQYTLEFSSGSIDRSESSQEAAARELYEETGYVCKAMSCLGVGRIMMNRHACRVFTFLGVGATRDPSFLGQESIEVVLVSSAELKALVLSSQFEQLPALGLLVLAEWKLGFQLAVKS
jgi:ADP-ribose pyrophosphatase